MSEHEVEREHEVEAVRSRLLLEYLEAIEAACPSCGYNLHRIKGAICPECAQRLTLRVELAQPKMGAFVFGLIGWSVGTGFHGILGLWGLWLNATNRGGPSLTEMWPVFVGLVIELPALLLWLRMSGWLRRQPAPARWGLGVGAWIVTAALSVLFFAVIR